MAAWNGGISIAAWWIDELPSECVDEPRRQRLHAQGARDFTLFINFTRFCFSLPSWFFLSLFFIVNFKIIIN